MSWVWARTWENSMCHGIGAYQSGSPFSPRTSTLARSKRKPSTCISRTQYSRHSTRKRVTTGLLQLTVFPQAV